MWWLQKPINTVKALMLTLLYEYHSVENNSKFSNISQKILTFENVV